MFAGYWDHREYTITCQVRFDGYMIRKEISPIQQ
jgi:hypothetical protein